MGHKDYADFWDNDEGSDNFSYAADVFQMSFIRFSLGTLRNVFIPALVTFLNKMNHMCRKTNRNSACILLMVSCCLLVTTGTAWTQTHFPEFTPPVPLVGENEAPVSIDLVNAPENQPYDSESDLAIRLRRMEALLQQQSLRQAELEEELISSRNNTYVLSGNDDDSDTDLSKRLEKLEKSQAKADEAAAKKKAEDAPKPVLKISGRIQADYWTFPNTSPGANAFETGDANDAVEDRFLLRRLRLTFSGNVADNMLYKFDLEFSTPNAIGFRDAYLGWSELPFLQTLLVGNQKRPYGLDALYSSNFTIFLERPSIIDAFNNNARRFGLQSYGVSENEAWNWRYGGFMLEDVQQTGTVTATPDFGVYQSEVAGRLANTIWYDEASNGRGYAHWAVAGTWANPDGTDPAVNAARFRSRPEARTTNSWLDTGAIDGADNYEIGALEGVATWGPLQLTAELQQLWLQRDAASELSFNGGYVSLSYFLTGEHMPWDRKTGCITRVQPFENFFLVRTANGATGRGRGAWQVAARYTHTDLSDQDIFGGVADELTFALIWYWNPYARLIVNYEYGDITQHVPVDGQTDGTFNVIGMRFNLDF